MSKIKVGDFVMWRGAWGRQLPRKAKVERIEITDGLKDKEGRQATEVDSTHQSFIVDLDNGKWAYGWQVTPINQ